MGTLYIVSTPIGNLKDITFRALEVLSSVDLILAEDTRNTSKLLSTYKIKKPTIAFHEHNEINQIPLAVEKLKQGSDIALVSDAGTPLLSDPGFKLVRACVYENLNVKSIPGASSITSSLVVSGLPTNQFFFIGYLPKKSGKLTKSLETLKKLTDSSPTTVIFFESPYRIKGTIEKLAAIMPDRDLVITRELTKVHEEIIRGKVKDLVKQNIKTKGEFTLLLY